MIRLKSKEQIALLKEGGHILSSILDELEKVVRVGNTSLEVEDLAQTLMEKYKVTPMILG